MNQTLQKFAHTAVGIPVSAVSSLMDRLADARRKVEESATELSESARSDIDRWALEGEELVERILSRVRNEVAGAGDAVEAVVATATSEQVAVTEVPGIGPAYAERLSAEAVTTVAALLARTETDAELERLSNATDISVDRLSAWRERAIGLSEK